MPTKTIAFALALLGTSAAAPALAASCQLNDTDQAYLQEDASGSAYELALAQLATQKASDASVQRYATMVASDHEKYNAALQDLGRKCNVSLSTTPGQAEQAKLSSMQGLSGNQFDAAFITAARAINIEDTKTSRQEAQNTRNPAIKQFIERFKATDEKHTQAAEALNAEGPGHG